MSHVYGWCIFLVLFYHAQICSGDSAQSCPDALKLKPCTCDQVDNMLHVHCDHVNSWKIAKQSMTKIKNKANILSIHFFNVQAGPISGVFKGVKVSDLSISKSLMIRKNNKKNRAIVPKAFFNKATIFSLALENNDLARVPNRALAAIPMLQSLSLGSNKITHIKKNSFKYVPHVRYLDLSGNRLIKIHKDSLNWFDALEVLNLADNNIETLHPEVFSTLQRLTILDLSNNKLKTVHSSTFTCLSNVRHLSLAFNPQLMSLTNLSGDSNLTALEIGYTNLDLAPFADSHELRTLVNSNRSPLDMKHIMNMDELEMLDLQNNNINGHYLTDDVFIDLNHTFHNVQHLDMSFNDQLRNVVRVLQFFPSLTHLYLEKVRLKRLPANFSKPVPNLTYLFLKNCQLRKIHRLAFDELSHSLKEVHLSHNLLSALAVDTFYNMTNLTHVDLSFNRFCDVKGTPLNHDLFHGSVETLQHLSLASNYLQDIPFRLVSLLKNLVHLNMAGNNMSAVNDHKDLDLAKLESLNLNNNRIKHIAPNAFAGLLSLVELSISYNLLENLTSVIFPVTLQYLRLKDNQLVTLDGTTKLTGNLHTLPALRVVDVNDNKLINISGTAFDGAKDTLVYLDISGNMLNCSCGLKPFIDWLRTYRVSISSWTMCESPPTLKDHMLIHRICWSTCNTRQISTKKCGGG